MKTPREILLARHGTASDKLDAIRREVVAGELKLNNKGRTSASQKEQSRNFVAWLLRCLTAPWRELVLPSRRIWTGLAAVWVLLAAINLAQRDTVSSVTGQPVRSAPVVMSFQAQQRLMNEVLADRVAAPDADRPKNSSGPRSEVGGVAAV
jgi:hypothetical protein